MDIVELRGKTPDELQALLMDLKKEAFNLRFQQARGELTNTARIRVVRKTVARLQTLLKNPAAANAKVKPVEAKAPKKKAEKPAAKIETKKAETKKSAKKKAAAA